MDLGSRNGTYVNGVAASREQPTRVWHNDELKIGEWLLRASIRDQAGGPVLKAYMKSIAILDELDEINTALDSGSTTWHELGEDLAKPSVEEAHASTIGISVP